MKSYDDKKPNNYIAYLDAKILSGRAMSCISLIVDLNGWIRKKLISLI